jgi:hypothetical protein
MPIVQDDQRETQLIELFDLERGEEGRIGTDAYLDLNGHKIPFELKSTSRGSITTVRDFGPDHIRKWRNKHWLMGFYNSNGTQLLYCLYGSPLAMSPWINEKANYIAPDFELTKLAAKYLTLNDLYRILGKKDIYSLDDAQRIHKRQFKIAKYRSLMDNTVPEGYTPGRMLQILKARCAYLIGRGATLNNPHIPASYFDGWEQITENHSERLREMVAEAIAI